MWFLKCRKFINIVGPKKKKDSLKKNKGKLTKKKKRCHQSLSQSVSLQSVSRSVSQSVSQLIGHSITRSLGHSFTRSLVFSVTRLLGHSFTWPLSLSGWIGWFVGSTYVKYIEIIEGTFFCSQNFFWLESNSYKLICCVGPKDPLGNAMAEMMERIKNGNIQLKAVRTVSMDLSLMGHSMIVMLCCDI